MQKLTKSQAVWLIEKLEPLLQNPINGLTMAAYDDYEKIINQCTEKEFPFLRVETGVMDIEVSKNDYCEGVTCIQIIDGRNIKVIAGSIGLNIEEFKQFAEGVNKIVTWIEEQE